jgi:DNA-binding NtrC family response regulator
VTHFLANIGSVYRRRLAVSERALRWLQSQSWPGNVRQLKHLMERTVLISGHDRFEPQDFAAALEMEPKESSKESLLPAGEATMEEIERAMIVRALERHGHNIYKAASALGMTRQAFYRRLEKYGIQS